MLNQIWGFITSSNGLLQAIIIAVATATIARLATPRGRLFWATSHQHYYRMPNFEGGSFPVRTQQLWFQNLGRAPIDDVEIVLNWSPQHFEVWNPRAYTAATQDDGRLVLTFPYLAAGEAFTLSMIDTIQDLPSVISARSKSGIGRMIPMGPMRIFPKWVNVVLGALVLFGFASLVWFVTQFLV